MAEDTEKVLVYTLTDCDVSQRALLGLRSEGAEVEERNVMRNETWMAEALKIASTVPIIIRGDEVAVGWKGALG